MSPVAAVPDSGAAAVGEVAPAAAGDDGAAAAVADAADRARVAALDALLERLEQLPDATARATAVGALRCLLELYGEALDRILDVIARFGGDGALAALAQDELVAHLLLLHGLHPEPLETRVQRALDGVRPYLRSHGGDVELLALDGDLARLRLQGHCRSCPASTVTLRTAVEEALRREAPELLRIEADGVEPRAGFVPLAALGTGGAR